MRVVAFLRAVMPTGPNRIPKMSYLSEVLSDAGYGNVRTYIQSGNIILDTDMDIEETAGDIHGIIKDKIGADLKVIVKNVCELEAALKEHPYKDVEDGSCVFFVFTNEKAEIRKLEELQSRDWGEQKLYVGNECIHLWLPWDAKPKRLNNTYLEKQLGNLSTMRNRNVVEKVYEMAVEMEER